MKRSIMDRTILEAFAKDFVSVLDRQKITYIIVSGFVAIAHGRSRGTEDIDVILERMPKERFARLHAYLLKENFECVQAEPPEKLYTEYLSKGLAIRYFRKGSVLPEMEVKLAKDQLDEYQLETRKKLPFTDMDFYFSSVEMNIAFKEELLKSPKDIEDARHLRIIYEGKTDEKEIEKIKGEIRRLRLK
ncbi:MAG: hypothetical protein HYX24_05700 [Candidatus Aenigmarchaeota archaeon]|nr:hypothetical protein [Candidatus Aenigmarchaeota archaeon]